MMHFIGRVRDYLAQPATRTTVVWAAIAIIAFVFLVTAFGVNQR